MSKLSLLKECIKLMVETEVEGPQAPLTLSGPFKPAKRGGDYAIYREFPLAMTPELMQLMKVGPDDLTGDVLEGEQEIFIDVTDVYYNKGSRATFHDPGDPEEFLVEGWVPESINGVALTPQDAKTLKDFLGDLTEKEQEQIRESYMDSLGEPDYEPDYDF